MGETHTSRGLYTAGGNGQPAASRRTRQGLLACLGLGGMAILIVSGCDSLSFTPPRPAGLSSGPARTAPLTTAAPSSPSSVSPTGLPATSSNPTGLKPASGGRPRLIELLYSQPPGVDRQFLAQFLRRDAGVRKCGFRVSGQDLKQPMTPDQLATAIRAAASRSTGALILEPIDAPEVRAAVHEAEARGLPIVLLDTQLPNLSPGKYFPTVVFTGFADAGKQIVDVVIEDARQLHLPDDGPVLVLEYPQKDHYSSQRLDSLTSALKMAHRKYDVVTYSGEQAAALETATSYLKNHPKTTIILSDYDFGIAGSYQAFAQVWNESKRIVVRGGYAALDARLEELIVQMTEALADRNIEGYSRKALELAIAMMEGKSAPERVDLPITFKRNPPRTPPTVGAKARQMKGLSGAPQG